MARWIDHPDWGDGTARLLHESLARAYWQLADMQEVWQAVGMDPAAVSWSGTARSLWPALTRDAAGAGRLRELIGLVRQRRAAVAADLDRVLAAEVTGLEWYTSGDRYTSRLVGPGSRRAVLDRARLRSNLRSLAGGYPVLSIQGGSGSGKTHSRHLIQHVAADPAVDCELRILEIGEEWPDDAEVDAVAFTGRLARRLGMPAEFSVDTYTEPMRTARELTSEFVGRFGALPARRRWLFIDGLDRGQVTAPVHAVVRNLAKEVEAGQLGQTQLIVTGQPEDFTGAVLDVLLEERIEAVTAAHLNLFFAEVAADVGEPLTADERARMVSDVLAVAQLTDLRGVGLAASRVAHEKFGRRP